MGRAWSQADQTFEEIMQGLLQEHLFGLIMELSNEVNELIFSGIALLVVWPARTSPSARFFAAAGLGDHYKPLVTY